MNYILFGLAVYSLIIKVIYYLFHLKLSWADTENVGISRGKAGNDVVRINLVVSEVHSCRSWVIHMVMMIVVVIEGAEGGYKSCCF